MINGMQENQKTSLRTVMEYKLLSLHSITDGAKLKDLRTQRSKYLQDSWFEKGQEHW